MIGLLIFFGIIGAIATYVILSHHCIEILDSAGCRGTFIEWFTCLCPLVHIIVYVKYKEIAGYKPLKFQIGKLKTDYETMVDKLNQHK